jgi:hypothetical protein
LIDILRTPQQFSQTKVLVSVTVCVFSLYCQWSMSSLQNSLVLLPWSSRAERETGKPPHSLIVGLMAIPGSKAVGPKQPTRNQTNSVVLKIEFPSVKKDLYSNNSLFAKH